MRRKTRNPVLSVLVQLATQHRHQIMTRNTSEIKLPSGKWCIKPRNTVNTTLGMTKLQLSETTISHCNVTGHAVNVRWLSGFMDSLSDRCLPSSLSFSFHHSLSSISSHFQPSLSSGRLWHESSVHCKILRVNVSVECTHMKVTLRILMSGTWNVGECLQK